MNQLTLRACFLYSTMSHGKFVWERIDFGSHESDMDTEVYVYLNSQVQRLDANKMLEVLKVVGEVAEWYLKYARSEASSVLVWKD